MNPPLLVLYVSPFSPVFHRFPLFPPVLRPFLETGFSLVAKLWSPVILSVLLAITQRCAEGVEPTSETLASSASLRPPNEAGVQEAYPVPGWQNRDLGFGGASAGPGTGSLSELLACACTRPTRERHGSGGGGRMAGGA